MQQRLNSFFINLFIPPSHLVVLENVPATVDLSRVQGDDSDEEGVQQRRQEQCHVDLLEEVLVPVLESVEQTPTPTPTQTQTDAGANQIAKGVYTHPEG